MTVLVSRSRACVQRVGHDRGRDRGAARARSRVRRPRRRRRLHRRHRGAGEARRGAGAAPPVQPRHRRRGAGRIRLRAASIATTTWPRSMATASTILPSSRRLVAAMDDRADVDMVCGSRFLTDDYHYPAPISRRTGIHVFAALLSRIVDASSQRSDLRLPPLQPAGDRVVRPRLSARLSRGRGGPDAPSSPAPNA